MDPDQRDPVGDNDEAADDEDVERPLSAWQSTKEVAAGLAALLLAAVGVLALYVAGGFLAGLVAWAAPAVLACAAAVFLGRYLARRNDQNSSD